MQTLRFALAAALVIAAGAAAAQPFDPNWPCEQRKVMRMSLGQVWTGPIPEDPEAWRERPMIADAAGRIAARRTSMEQAEAIVDEVLDETPEADRDEALTQLYSGVFALIDRERTRIVEGIERYTRKQRELAEMIDVAQAEVAAMRAEAGPEDFDALDRIEEREDQILWDSRIYEERRRSLQYVCESPVLLERRAFAIGRMIGGRLDGS